MENNEKLLEALKKIDVKSLETPEPIFSPETYELFKKSGLSEDEIATLENAELKNRVLEILPDDEQGIERVAGALSAISRDNGDENVKNLLLIAQKDPEMLAKLMALTEVFKTPVELKDDKTGY